MKDSCIRKYFNINKSFFRSTNLIRDLKDEGLISNYLLTDQTINYLRRISVSILPTSTQRAWRITGDYGTGKSSFALFLAKWFSGDLKDVSPETKGKLKNTIVCFQIQ